MTKHLAQGLTKATRTDVRILACYPKDVHHPAVPICSLIQAAAGACEEPGKRATLLRRSALSLLPIDLYKGSLDDLFKIAR
jgi:hypothetical protein